MVPRNGRSENYPNMTVEQQYALYASINPAIAMLLAQQTLMSPWPAYHPSPFNAWTMPTPLPFPAKFPGSDFYAPTHGSIINHHDSVSDSKESREPHVEPSMSSTSSTRSDSPPSPIEFGRKKAGSKKVFECDMCDKTFGYKHVLQNHRKVHTGEKSFRCLLCDKCFRRDHHLKVHIRQHTGEKPYSCDFPMCKKQFTQVANLRRHSKTHDVGHLIVNKKFLQTDDKTSRNSFTSETSEESLELQRISQDHADFSYADYRTPLTEPRYMSPEQSAPEDLSSKAHVREKEKRD